MTDSNPSAVSLPARLHAALRRTDRTVGAAWMAVVAACVLSRLATTITYIEDPDSLRFALSVADAYDLAALQPHFPGYPVFWAAAEVFYLPTGSFSTSFSLVGGLATAGLVAALLQIRRVPLASPEGLALTAAVFVNPLVWLMGNRYMPDLLGTTCALAALAFLADALTGEKTSERSAAIGVLLSGLLAGLRLSYMPLVVVPALWVLARSRRPLRLVGVGTAGVAVWLVPMIADTGFRTLVDVAWAQTTGHFTEFGGTVQTESDLSRRVVGFARGLWADGLGAWWPGRHPLTLAVGAGMVGLGGLGTWRLAKTGHGRSRRFWIVLGCAGLYAVWVFFFQNVVHKSRHLLPLLPLLLLLPAAGAGWLWRDSLPGRALATAVLVAYAGVTLVLVSQHLDPSAIAQAKTFVETETRSSSDPVRIASIPLVNTYLKKQRVDARFLSVDDSTDVRRLQTAATGRTLVVGTYGSLFDRPPDRVRTFYHNPFVNRMWPDVRVYVYDHGSSHDR